MTLIRLERGKRGEEEAGKELTRRGYRIMMRNYRCSLGEIDIITEKGDKIVFVEVKTRTSLAFGLPQENVTYQKQEKIKKVAQVYLSSRQQFYRNIGFCVVAVQLDKEGHLKKMEVIEDAF